MMKTDGKTSKKFEPLIWLVIASLSSFVSFSTAKAQDLILRANPSASSQYILVGDIFKNAGDKANVKIAIAPKTDQKTVFSADALKTRVQSLGLKWQKPNNLMQVTIYGAQSNNQNNDLLQPLNIESEAGEIAVLNRDLNRDENITYDMISIIKAPANAENAISDISQLIGMRAKTNLKANMPIKANDIANALAVKRGDNIIVLHQVSGLKISMQAKALENGIAGQKIKVLNEKANKILEIVVEANGQGRAISTNNLIASAH